MAGPLSVTLLILKDEYFHVKKRRPSLFVAENALAKGLGSALGNLTKLLLQD